MAFYKKVNKLICCFWRLKMARGRLGETQIVHVFKMCGPVCSYSCLPHSYYIPKTWQAFNIGQPVVANKPAHMPFASMPPS